MATLLRLQALTDTELETVQRLLVKMTAFAGRNEEATLFYDASVRWKNLGIAIPVEMEGWLDTVLGWSGIAVDTLEERLDWTGWVTDRGDDYGLGDIYTDNQLALEASLLHLDALIYGVAFWSCSKGAQGEPDPLVIAESPLTATYEWSRRARRATAGLVIGDRSSMGAPASVSLHLPGQTVVLRASRSMEPGQWVVEERIDYPHQAVPLIPVVNRPWGTRRAGRSEITRAMRSIQMNAMRTLAGWEIAREFFAAPQRYAMGADEKSFVDADGKPLTAWEAYIGRVWAIERDETGEVPEVGQFPSAAPDAYFLGLRGLGSLFAAEAGLAVSYLGIPTDQPASADAIRAGDARMLKRAERRHTQFGSSHHQLAEQAFMITHNTDTLPEEFRGVDEAWSDPATPTRAASADAATKLVGAGVLPPESEVTMEWIGLSASDQRRLKAERQRRSATETLELLAGITTTDDTEVDQLVET